MPATNKLQRWVDLLAALLGRHVPVTFEALAREVPAYARAAPLDCTPKDRASIKRAFERDKRELRELGVPIETVDNGDSGEDAGYRLRTTEFYLPYLSVAGRRGASKPRKVDQYGYRALASLTFDADELRAVVEGAARAKQLGNGALDADVDSALRKLACDLPVHGVAAPNHVHIAQPRAKPSADALEALARALHARRRVTFDYHAFDHDRVSHRTAEPYGLFFLNTHWYLAARDVDKSALRNFRVSRMSAVKPSSADKERPDYQIPAGFHLHEHARSRNAWELGDGEAVDAIVEFRGQSGATRAAAALGQPADDDPDRRAFRVRRPDAFVRWLLSFAGEVIPVRPATIVDAWRDQVRNLRATYADRAASPNATSVS
jgi:predicted DNA-binding transcriptional regulator YafY